MYKLCFFVPESHVEQVKAALFAQGAGKIGEYDCCAWQVLGTGQFKPLAASRLSVKPGKLPRLMNIK